MKSYIIIFFIAFYAQILFSQKEIIGHVEFYKSIKNDWKILESNTDKSIQFLSNRKNKIKLIQGDTVISSETNEDGFFKIKSISKDSIKIKVNDGSRVFNSFFSFHYNQIKDTLWLKISDKKLSVHRDSIVSPKFHNKYSENQAKLDLEKGNVKLLAFSVCWPTEESITRRKLIALKYDIDYEYLSGIEPNKIRIMYRYNQIIKKNLGITEKSVW